MGSGLKDNFQTVRQISCKLYVELHVELVRCDNSVLNTRTMASFLGNDGELFRGEVPGCLPTTLGWLGRGETCI